MERRYNQAGELVIFANKEEIHQCYEAYESRKSEARKARADKFFKAVAPQYQLPVAANDNVIQAPITKPEVHGIFKGFGEMAAAIQARVFP